MLDKVTGTAPSAYYSLLDPLPSDVVLGSGERPGDYRSYPVFSVPWLSGRSRIFVPAAAGWGLVQAILVCASLNHWRLFVLCSAVGVPGWVLIVTAGPGLATFVRHQRWPLAWERLAVFAAIGVGLGTSYGVRQLANVTLGPAYRAVIGDSVLRQLPKPSADLAVLEGVFQLGFFFCLGGGLGLRSYVYEEKRWLDAQRQRELESLRREKGEADLRVAVLQAQVEPHFLFNTLASVHSLIRQDPERAEATVEALVDHLRATMPKLRASIGLSYSTLADQLEVCESYLKVMQVRMGPRLTYVRDVPFNLLGHPFPPLMLISLVENAVKHGIEPRPGGGNISLSAVIEDRGMTPQLAVSVIDDGVGLRPGIGGGVGLENIRAHLAARFGDYGELHVRARPCGGVAATIRVPCVKGMP